MSRARAEDGWAVVTVLLVIVGMLSLSDLVRYYASGFQTTE